MQLFIDTNIYLDYFRSQKEQLTSLTELKKLLKSKKIVLLLPKQTEQEYIRLRGKIVEETRAVLMTKKKQLGNQLPSAPSIKEMPEAEKIRSEINKVEDEFKNLIEKYDDLTDKEKTPSDQLLKEVFSLAKKVPDNKTILANAHVRYLRGYPPRKSDHSYGDAIIWETLLEKATGDDLTIISRDTDFVEVKREKEMLATFLTKEWSGKSKKKVQLFASLGEFINSIEGKETIKKEIIKKEKVDPHPEDAYRWISGETFGSLQVNPGQVYVSGLRAGTASVYSPSVYGNTVSVFPSKVNYCPYCGHAISPPDDYGFGTVTAVGLRDNYVCPNCLRSIDLSNLR